MKNIKLFLKNDYSLSIFSKIITAFIGIISSAFSTRFLGVRYKGDYAYICHIANILVLVLNLGIYQSYSYNYKKIGKGIIQKYIDIIFFQFFIMLSAMSVIIITSKDYLTIMIALLVPFNILKLQYGNIVLIENFKLSLFISIINSFLCAICYISLYFWAEPNIFFVVALTVAVDILSVLIYCFKLKVFPKLLNVDFAFLKSVLHFGYLPMLSSLLATINYSIDIIFLKNIGFPEELSYYALAAGIINYVWLIPDAFKSVLFSKSAHTFDKDSLEFSSQISSFFITLCFLGFLILGKQLIALFYGFEFINSYQVTLLLMVGAFSMSIYKLVGVVLVSQGRRIAHFISLAISAVVNIFLNYILIPMFGMYGAGIASVCSYTICGAILLLYFCFLYNMNPVVLIFPTHKTISKIKNRF